MRLHGGVGKSVQRATCARRARAAKQTKTTTCIIPPILALISHQQINKPAAKSWKIAVKSDKGQKQIPELRFQQVTYSLSVLDFRRNVRIVDTD